MRVSDFDDFDRFETEGLLTGTKERSWLWFGLIVSLGIHLALCAYFYRTRFQTVEALTPPNNTCPTIIHNPEVHSPCCAVRSRPQVRRSSAPTPLPASCLVTAPDQSKGIPPASATWINCSRKKVRWGQAQNYDCLTINSSNTTATCFNQALSVNCKSWALSSSVIRKLRFPSKVTRIHSAHSNTTSI